jgi:hypothetical protein
MLKYKRNTSCKYSELIELHHCCPPLPSLLLCHSCHFFLVTFATAAQRPCCHFPLSLLSLLPLLRSSPVTVAQRPCCHSCHFCHCRKAVLPLSSCHFCHLCHCCEAALSLPQSGLVATSATAAPRPCCHSCHFFLATLATAAQRPCCHFCHCCEAALSLPRSGPATVAKQTSLTPIILSP